MYRSDTGVGAESHVEGYSAGLAKAAGKEYGVDGAGTGADASGAGDDSAGAGADAAGAGADAASAGADGTAAGADGTGTGADGADGGVVERYRRFMEWRLEKVDDVNSVGGIRSVVDEDVGKEDINGVGIGLGERSSTDTARGFDKGDGIDVKYGGYAGDGGCGIDAECGGDVRYRGCVRYGTDAACRRCG